MAMLFLGGPALADGQPKPWQWNLQPAASPVAEEIHSFNILLISVEVGISVLVLALMGYIMFRFSAKRNPTPSKRSHNSVLEVLWTAAPILILVVVAVPSLKLLFFMDRTHEADMTLKVTGHQWYWSYEYPDHGEFAFDSLMLQDDELEPGQPRLLAVDNEVVLPVDTNVRVLLTSADVIHSWAVPAFGIKTDTVPGRTNETWVQINKEGTYYGQCSELCGVNHGFMPIAIRAVSKEEFDAWIETAKTEFARNDGPVPHVTQAAGPSAVR
jgi:cytochrome c oxidase subunit 2